MINRCYGDTSPDMVEDDLLTIGINSPPIFLKSSLIRPSKYPIHTKPSSMNSLKTNLFLICPQTNFELSGHHPWSCAQSCNHSIPVLTHCKLKYPPQPPSAGRPAEGSLLTDTLVEPIHILIEKLSNSQQNNGQGPQTEFF